MVDHVHVIFKESSSETGEGGMIGSGIVKRKTKELFKGDSVVDLCFQFRIGIDLKLLLKKTFHKEKGRIGIITFKAFTDRLFSQKQAFNSGPVDEGVEMFHSFNSPVLFHGVKKGNISEGEVCFHIFEAHSFLQKVLFEGIMPEKHRLVKTYMQ